MSYSLQLMTPVIDGGTSPIVSLTDIALGWERVIHLQGGYWSGHFDILGDASELTDYFYNWLNLHIQEESGGLRTWEGRIVEMDLSTGNATRRKSLLTMANKVRVDYTDDNGDSQRTAWATQAQSIAQYGEQWEILGAYDYIQLTAEAKRAFYLAHNAWPIARPAGGIAAAEYAALSVTVGGYIGTLNNRYTTTGVGVGNLSARISEIVTTDSEFLVVTRIDTNTVQVSNVLDDDSPIRPWDLILEYAELGDADQNLWRFFVDNDRRVYYHQLATQPTYFLRGGQVYLSSGGGAALEPWQMQPGIYRDLDVPVSGKEKGSVLDDLRDIIVDKVRVSADGQYTLSAADIMYDEQFDALQNYLVAAEIPKVAETPEKKRKFTWPTMNEAQRAWLRGRIGPYPG